MTTIMFIGGEETGNVDHVAWGRFRFDIRVPVECDDPHIIAKARKNRFFQVDGPIEADPPKPIDPLDHDGDGHKGGVVKLDPLAKARAAKAAKRASAQGGAA